MSVYIDHGTQVRRVVSAVTIRWAAPHEGLVIQQILQSQQVLLATQADWTQSIGHSWLIAETTHPCGCIMVNPGRPVGRLEWLTVRPDTPKRQYALICRDLCYAGMEVLAQGGSQFMATYIADHDTGWSRIVQRRGCVPQEQGTLVMKRL